MAERPEDLNLPNAVVTRIIKEALPSGVNIGKDARLAISKAASVFVLYATSWWDFLHFLIALMYEMPHRMSNSLVDLDVGLLIMIKS